LKYYNNFQKKNEEEKSVMSGALKYGGQNPK